MSKDKLDIYQIICELKRYDIGTGPFFKRLKELTSSSEHSKIIETCICFFFHQHEEISKEEINALQNVPIEQNMLLLSFCDIPKEIASQVLNDSYIQEIIKTENKDVYNYFKDIYKEKISKDISIDMADVLIEDFLGRESFEVDGTTLEVIDETVKRIFDFLNLNETYKNLIINQVSGKDIETVSLKKIKSTGLFTRFEELEKLIFIIRIKNNDFYVVDDEQLTFEIKSKKWITIEEIKEKISDLERYSYKAISKEDLSIFIDNFNSFLEERGSEKKDEAIIHGYIKMKKIIKTISNIDKEEFSVIIKNNINEKNLDFNIDEIELELNKIIEPRFRQSKKNQLELVKIIIKKSDTFSCELIEQDSFDYSLSTFIGQPEVKGTVRKFVSRAKLNEYKKMNGLNVESIKLNSIFSGSPGTGKTTVAKMVGNQLKKLGLISKGHFRLVTKADLIGNHVGETEVKCKELMKEMKGGILFIDEAYSLNDKINEADGYGKAALNTIMEEADKMDNDIMIILAGYEDKMQDVLDCNRGLARRFPFKLQFKDYSEDELMEIFKSKIEEKEYKITDKQLELVRKIIREGKEKTNFGNAGFVMNIIEQISLNIDDRLQYKAETNQTLKKEHFLTIFDKDIEKIKINTEIF